MDQCDVAVVGSGMGSLATAALLAKRGLKVVVFEQNYLPGGCTSSYWRKVCREVMYGNKDLFFETHITCCIQDGGRPTEGGLQEQPSNHPTVLFW